VWAADLCATAFAGGPCENAADVFLSFPGSLTYAIPVTEPPAVTVVGYNNNSARNYVLSQNIPGSTGVECNTPSYFAGAPFGQVTGIETSSYSSDLPIQVGKCPVYAVTSSDGQRLFVLNRASNSITVINLQSGLLDENCPAKNQDGQTINCPPNGTLQLPAGSGPVYAEYNAATSQLVVSNYDGGTVSIIDVTLDSFGNDSSTFGTTYTVPVGNNPASVTVLYDGSRAYTANQTDQTVTVVNLSSHTVEKTLPVTGHPRTVVSIQNSNYGKVYVASPDTNLLTIISAGGSNPDTIDATITLQGDYVVDVRVTTQNGVYGSGNNNNVSRIPGYGEPCNLPPALMGASYTLAQCQALP
jgi:YVTN family beta-propeller protein